VSLPTGVNSSTEPRVSKRAPHGAETVKERTQSSGGVTVKERMRSPADFRPFAATSIVRCPRC